MGAKLSDIGKIVANALTSKSVLEVGAQVIIESVPKRTRLGKGVKENGANPEPLPVLKEKTKYNRKLLSKNGKLTGPGARPAKSGLNASGKLLTGLKAIFTGNGFTVELADREQERKAADLLKINPGFSFMNVSKPELNRAIKAMSAKITEIVNKIKFDSL